MEFRVEIKAFFDPTTHTVSYVVSDPSKRECAIIDPVLDYDPRSGRTATHCAAQIIEHVRTFKLVPRWILETHVHADHITAAQYMRQVLGGAVAIGSRVTDVQRSFTKVFNSAPDVPSDGSQFDHLFTDEELFFIGEVPARALSTPGHTPACMTYVIGDAAFVGDTLLMPDAGTARTDFLGGSASILFHSIQKILSLPPPTRIFVGHDYGTPERTAFAWESTVGEQRRSNIHLKNGTDEAAFVRMRTGRDATLEVPNLMLPAVQVNIRAGRLPSPESNGVHYLKIPVNVI